MVVSVKCETLPIANFLKTKFGELSGDVMIDPKSHLGEYFAFKPLRPGFREPLKQSLALYAKEVELKLDGHDRWLTVREFLLLDEDEFS